MTTLKISFEILFIIFVGIAEGFDSKLTSKSKCNSSIVKFYLGLFKIFSRLYFFDLSKKFDLHEHITPVRSIQPQSIRVQLLKVSEFATGKHQFGRRR